MTELNDTAVLAFSSQLAAMYTHLVNNGVQSDHARDMVIRYIDFVENIQLSKMNQPQPTLGGLFADAIAKAQERQRPQ